MNSVLANPIPVGLPQDQVQTINTFFILAAPCPEVHYKRTGEKVCNCNPCLSCGHCRGGHQ